MLKALAKDPAQRYTDADSFMRDLEAVEPRLERGAGDAESTAVFRSGAGSPAPAAAAPAAGRRRAPAAGPPRRRGEPPPPTPSRRRASRPEPPPALARRWPLAGASLRRAGGCSLFLLLGSEQRTVPLVARADARQRARASSTRAGFKVDIERRTDPAPRDTVFDQVPERRPEGRQGLDRDAVRLERPEHRQGARRGRADRADARRRLRRAGLRPDVEQESSTKVAAGHRDPLRSRARDARSSAAPRVTLFVSTGPKQVDGAGRGRAGPGGRGRRAARGGPERRRRARRPRASRRTPSSSQTPGRRASRSTRARP